MSSVFTTPPPSFSNDEALSFLKSKFDISGTLERLPSDRDQVFHVQGDADSSRQRMTMRSGDSDSNGIEEPLNFNYLDTAGSTSAITYGIRLHNSDNGSQTLYLNRSSNDNDSQTTTTRTVSTITAMEIKG